MPKRPRIGVALVARHKEVRRAGGLERDEPGAMLIYSMSVSVDGFISDREGAFGWTLPNEVQSRFHIAQTRKLGGLLLGRRLYEDPGTPKRQPRSRGWG